LFQMHKVYYDFGIFDTTIWSNLSLDQESIVIKNLNNKQVKKKLANLKLVKNLTPLYSPLLLCMMIESRSITLVPKGQFDIN
jgi:hypothetical protein